MRVLIIDDQEIFRNCHRRAVEREGFDHITARDGQFVYGCFEKVQECDLIITDCRMNEVSGVEVIQFLAARGWKKPVLLTSSEATSADGLSLQELADEYPWVTYASKRKPELVTKFLTDHS